MEVSVIIPNFNGIAFLDSVLGSLEGQTLKNFEVIRGIDPSLDREAVRVIREMPKWNPGVQNNMAVAVKYTVPVTFRLQ